MNIKRTLLTLLIAGLAFALPLSACQGRQCPRGQGSQRPEGHRGHHRHGEHPVWKDVEGQADMLDVKEGNVWVQYKKTTKQCPPMAHGHHGQWQGHQHHHDPRHQHAHGQHQERHGHQGHHGPHHSHRHVRYQRNQDGTKIDGVLNVWEKGANDERVCFEYTRTATTRNLSAEDAAFVAQMEQQLEVD